MTVRTYSVPAISCGHCKSAIESEVAPLAGVESAVVDIDARTLTVIGDVSEDAVRAAVDEAGYEVASVV
ncbi:MAG: heavy-metal-associated domain-containing protein [Acidimicrobiia bacterium]|nr:heavy-metal-associated domain-containing protein [Acidimicrobiia bacterium]